MGEVIWAAINIIGSAYFTAYDWPLSSYYYYCSLGGQVPKGETDRIGNKKLTRRSVSHPATRSKAVRP